MKNYKRILLFIGVITIITAILHAAMGFSPTVSLYFGAPEVLVQNDYVLIISCILIAIIIAIFGLYAISGAGYIRPLPWIKQVLAAISSLFILRGILFIPELMIVLDFLDVSFPVAPRYAVFSFGIFLVGLVYSVGTVSGWSSFPSK
jgi:hypothetical protein